MIFGMVKQGANLLFNHAADKLNLLQATCMLLVGAQQRKQASRSCPHQFYPCRASLAHS